VRVLNHLSLASTHRDDLFRYFRDQPLLHPDVNDEYLLLCYFEDWLKKYFFSVLQILEVTSVSLFLSSSLIGVCRRISLWTRCLMLERNH